MVVYIIDRYIVEAVEGLRLACSSKPGSCSDAVPGRCDGWFNCAVSGLAFRV